ncbi:MAG TPA: cytochrome c3 family protein [Casimicrobiaceae bacterium]|nr:cytochrome c3 family protein [Casimicrobiaceae bacterium]
MLAPIVRAFLLAILVAAGSVVHAQGASKDAPAGPNDGCLMCHGDPGAKSGAGKVIAVDAKKFAASVHGSMSLPCNACHADVKEGVFPHGEVKPAQCASCHDQAVKDYAATLHGQARKDGRQSAATCADCHGTHDIAKKSDPASRVHRANLEATCAACHGNEALIEKAHMPGGNVASKYHDSIHGQAIARKTSAKDAVPVCTDCHGTHDMRAKSDPKSRVARANIPATCSSCHMNVKAEWEQSQHGKLRQAAVLQAPGCTDCHSAHEIQQHADPKFALAVTDRCGTCHADFARTYRDTFHGQVTQLGYTQIATCASCHGAHQVLPKDNPLSKVSDRNRVATCQGCHPKANVNFASYDPHANRHVRERGQLLFFTGKFMDLLLLGVFSVFGVHTVLWFVRSLKAVRERRNQPPRS